MISQKLEGVFHAVFDSARKARHEFVSVEHLLLALLDEETAAEALRACSVNVEHLRKLLTDFVNSNTSKVDGIDSVDTMPTAGFERVIQRAIMRVQTTGNGKREVTGADVLLAIFGEKDSQAVRFLEQQKVVRLDVVNFIVHSIRKEDWRQYEWALRNENNLLSALDEQSRERVKQFLDKHRT